MCGCVCGLWNALRLLLIERSHVRHENVRVVTCSVLFCPRTPPSGGGGVEGEEDGRHGGCCWTPAEVRLTAVGKVAKYHRGAMSEEVCHQKGHKVD